jgi:hypothetical protein
MLAAPTYAVLVGWSVDVHQGKWNGQYWPPGVPVQPPYPLPPPNLPFPNFANDFHIWGVVESMLTPPTLVRQVNFQTTGPFTVPPFQRIPGGLSFPNFTFFWSQTPPFPMPLPPLAPPPGPPGAPFYYFEAMWFDASGLTNVMFCQWMHFGLLFNVNGGNYGYWLQGMWTFNGVDPPGPPICGWEVGPGPHEKEPIPLFIRIGNQSGVELFPIRMDLMVLDADEGRAFPLEKLNTDFFDSHPEWNQRWVPVPPPLVPQVLPGDFSVDSFFDVFLGDVPGLPPLLPGQILLARQHFSYYDESYGEPAAGEAPAVGVAGNAHFWQYEIHGQPLPGDITDEGHVDVVDLLWFVDAFGSVAGDVNYDPLADFNYDGSVDVVDLLWLVQYFGW